MRQQASWWAALLAGVILQTTLFPLFFPDPWRPDLTRALVLWVALTGTPRGGALLAAAAGFVLDAASGTPLGFGILLRLGLYGLARPFRGVFFDDRPLLLLPFAAAGAMTEAIGAGTLSWVAFRHPIAPATLLAVGGAQAVVDAFCVPAVFLCLELAFRGRPRREAAA